MPTFQAKTIAATQVWKSPDGQRTIFEVTLQTGQGSANAKTYSAAIGQIGFEGEVETYEKPGQKGPEVFVKQVAKENPGYTGGGSYSGGGKAGSKPVSDPFTMYLSYAKDLAVAVMHEGKIDSQLYAEALEMVLVGGQTLYDGRPDAPAKEVKPATDLLTVVDQDFNQQLDDAFSAFGAN